MIAFALKFVFFLSPTASFAGEVASANAAKNKSAPVAISQESVSSLGTCKPAASDEEASARKLAEAEGLGKEELLARLIYSETLSTGYWNGLCNASNADDIMTTIGWGTMNRVKKKTASSLDAYSDVIFGKKQFSTSFSGKKKNPFAESFLCPLNSQQYLDGAKKKSSGKELFAKSRAIARDIVRQFENGGIPQHYRGITNFFYPHSEYFGEMRPSWAPDKDPSKNKGYVNLLGAKEKPCVEFYRLK